MSGRQLTAGPGGSVAEAGPQGSWSELLVRTAAALGSDVEARWLVGGLGGVGTAELWLRGDHLVPSGLSETVARAVERRLSGEPLQHVLGRWSFRGVEVLVDQRALVPRPETEVVVEVALAHLAALGPESARGGLALDLGTGSGVIGLALATERPRLRVLMTDRSREALEVASASRALADPSVRDRIEIREGSWYEAVPSAHLGMFACVVSNPPYLAEHEWASLPPEVRQYDPYGALVAGPTGLEAIGEVLEGAPAWLAPRGAVVVEIAPHQEGAAQRAAREAGFANVRVVPDLSGRPRVLVGEK